MLLYQIIPVAFMCVLLEVLVGGAAFGVRGVV